MFDKKKYNKEYRKLNKKKLKKWAKKYYKQYYINNKKDILEATSKYHKKYKKQRLKRGKEIYNQRKVQWLNLFKQLNLTTCSRCDYNKYFEVIHFHHKNSSKKKFNISGFMNKSFSKKNIDLFKKEVKKTTPLCANCHIEKHIKNKRRKY